MGTHDIGLTLVAGASSGNAHARASQGRSGTKWKDVLTRTVDVGGVSFAYRELGSDSGVPVIFLHHLMAVLDDWDPRVMDGIAAQRRVIAFDNRGVGASGGLVPPSLDDMARDAIAFIRALGFKQVDLLGFSLGGGVAQAVALQAPDLIRRMILAGNGAAGRRRYRRDQQNCRHRVSQGRAHAERSEELPVLSAYTGGQARREGLFQSAERAHRGARQADLTAGSARSTRRHQIRRAQRA
jgi:pimeloyl-ACP methyl ester carboxylesterase